jgi:hypothetical protein
MYTTPFASLIDQYVFVHLFIIFPRFYDDASISCGFGIGIKYSVCVFVCVQIFWGLIEISNNLTPIYTHIYQVEYPALYIIRIESIICRNIV